MWHDSNLSSFAQRIDCLHPDNRVSEQHLIDVQIVADYHNVLLLNAAQIGYEVKNLDIFLTRDILPGLESRNELSAQW